MALELAISSPRTTEGPCHGRANPYLNLRLVIPDPSEECETADKYATYPSVRKIWCDERRCEPESSRVIGSHYSAFSHQGRRQTMEDMFTAIPGLIGSKALHFFGVFDGHGQRGRDAASFVSRRLPEAFEAEYSKQPQPGNMQSAMRSAFLKTDSDIMDEIPNGGSTAVICVIDCQERKLHVANAGDSRCVVSRNGHAEALSVDHSPDRADERSRIEEAGGRVVYTSGWRVEGILSVSRCIGDKRLKQFVIACPDTTTETIDSSMQLLILATDGLWRVLSNQRAVDIALGHKSPKDAAEALCMEALSLGSLDNVCAVVVDLRPYWRGTGLGFEPSPRSSLTNGCRARTPHTCTHMRCSDRELAKSLSCSGKRSKKQQHMHRHTHHHQQENRTGGKKIRVTHTPNSDTCACHLCCYSPCSHTPSPASVHPTPTSSSINASSTPSSRLSFTFASPANTPRHSATSNTLPHTLSASLLAPSSRYAPPSALSVSPSSALFSSAQPSSPLPSPQCTPHAVPPPAPRSCVARFTSHPQFVFHSVTPSTTPRPTTTSSPSCISTPKSSASSSLAICTPQLDSGLSITNSTNSINTTDSSGPQPPLLASPSSSSSVLMPDRDTKDSVFEVETVSEQKHEFECSTMAVACPNTFSSFSNTSSSSSSSQAALIKGLGQDSRPEQTIDVVMMEDDNGSVDATDMASPLSE